MTGDAPTMHIGELTDATGLSLRTLRHYDEIGLLRSSGRTEGGYRLYSQADLDRLLLIRRMKPLGFSLDEMSHLLDLVDQDSSEGAPTDDTSARLDAFIVDVRERREKLRQQLTMADEFLDQLHRRRNGESSPGRAGNSPAAATPAVG
jgi:MerR family copper efflux transcriptional regulator